MSISRLRIGFKRLQVIKLFINSFYLKEFSVCSPFNDFSALENDDLIGINDG